MGLGLGPGISGMFIYNRCEISPYDYVTLGDLDITRPPNSCPLTLGNWRA